MAEQIQQEVSEADRLLFEYEFVRRSGVTNMMDRRAVMVIAESAGFDFLFNTAASHNAYAHMLKDYKPPNEEAYLAWLMSEGLVTDEDEYWSDQEDD